MDANEKDTLNILLKKYFEEVNENACKHKWEKIAKTFAPPHSLGRGEKIKGDDSTIERYMSGVTTIMYKCEKCSEIRKEEMLGREVK
jgi:hypothetical protein